MRRSKMCIIADGNPATVAVVTVGMECGAGLCTRVRALSNFRLGADVCRGVRTAPG